MFPLVTFGDPERVLVDYLAAVLAGSQFTPLTVATYPPDEQLAGYHVQVECDGPIAGAYPVAEFSTVRVTCHAPSTQRTKVKALASLVQGVVYRHQGSNELAGIVPLLGRSAVVVDPTTRNLMVWFTVRATMRPQQAVS